MAGIYRVGKQEVFEYIRHTHRTVSQANKYRLKFYSSFCHALVRVWWHVRYIPVGTCDVLFLYIFVLCIVRDSFGKNK